MVFYLIEYKDIYYSIMLYPQPPKGG